MNRSYRKYRHTNNYLDTLMLVNLFKKCTYVQVESVESKVRGQHPCTSQAPQLGWHRGLYKLQQQWSTPLL